MPRVTKRLGSAEVVLKKICSRQHIQQKTDWPEIKKGSWAKERKKKTHQKSSPDQEEPGDSVNTMDCLQSTFWSNCLSTQGLEK
mmetsp:Transcript_18676/g.33091  ORF Transcript_18676/g.33091 Transcript_18676/m.33091 type:complete len:84 (+) Transcript_18676:951-1202(+)